MGSHTKFKDIRLNYCRYGMPYKKTTRFRVWNGRFDSLGRQCTTKNGVHNCGSAYHTHLEFGGVSTASTAAYSHQVCDDYTLCIEAMADNSEAPLTAPHPTDNIRQVEA